MSLEVSGYFYPQGKSSRLSATLRYSADGLFLIQTRDHSDSDTLVAQIPVHKTQISSRVGNTSRFINLDGQGQFESADNDTIDLILDKATQDGYLKLKPNFGLAHILESKTKYVMLTLLIMATASLAFVRFGIPFLGEEIALALPLEASQQLGKGGLELLDQTVFQESEIGVHRQNELRERFRFITQTLQSNSPIALLPMTIEFRKSETLGANAFALPSGTIIFTDDMIKLANSNAQLETIMLHEIGHIAHRHSLRQLIQQSSVAIFIVLLTGDISTTSQAVLALPAVLLQAGYSQDMELEADDFALKHLQLFNLAAEDFVTLMKKIEDTHTHQNDDTSSTSDLEILDYFSTHPRTKERLERFGSRASSLDL